MAKKRIESCRSGKDFYRFAKKASKSNTKIEIVPGKGSHVKIRVKGKGMWTLPVHDTDMKTGIRNATIKMFKALGIATLILLVVIANL